MSNQKKRKNDEKSWLVVLFHEWKSEKNGPNQTFHAKISVIKKRKVFILMHVRKQTVIAQDFSALFRKNNLQNCHFVHLYGLP